MKKPAQFDTPPPDFGTIEAALAELQRMIRAGREFPDAAFAVAQNHKVDQAQLEVAYDNSFQ